MQNRGTGQGGPKEAIVILLSDLPFHHRFYPSWNLHIHLIVHLCKDLCPTGM